MSTLIKWLKRGYNFVSAEKANESELLTIVLTKTIPDCVRSDNGVVVASGERLCGVEITIYPDGEVEESRF